MKSNLIRIINGHKMQIYTTFEQGGGEEEVSFWCHSCDRTGKFVISLDLREYSSEDAIELLKQQAEAHAESPVKV